MQNLICFFAVIILTSGLFIMLISDNENIREVIAFPFNQRAQDLMMNAPVQIDDKQLKELNIKKT